MENKWEYNYSSYQGRPGDTSSYSTDEACGYTAPGAARPPQEETAAPESAPRQDYYETYGYGSQPPRRKKSPGKKLLRRALSLVLVAAVGFGGGVAGARFAGSGARVVYQTVERGVLPAGTGSVAEGQAMTTTQVAGMVSPSVVVITTEELVSSNTWFGGQYVESGAGSGVIMSSDGYILTCAHVVDTASSIKVTLADDTEYTATLVGSDAQSDVAVLKVEAEGLSAALMGDSAALAVGESVLAVGNPLGELGGTVTDGIVSALDREIQVNASTMTVIQTNAAVSPGNSGGGLFNSAGELIGIVNAKSTGSYSEGLGFAIPVNTALDIAQDLIEVGHVTGRPAMGISVINITDAQTAAQYGVTTYGVYIVEVNEGGGAEKAGLKPGDMFVSVDSTMISTTSELTDIIAQHQAGDTVTVQVSRDRQLLSFDITLGESGQ